MTSRPLKTALAATVAVWAAAASASENLDPVADLLQGRGGLVVQSLTGVQVRVLSLAFPWQTWTYGGGLLTDIQLDRSPVPRLYHKSMIPICSKHAMLGCIRSTAR